LKLSDRGGSEVKKEKKVVVVEEDKGIR